MKFKQFVDVVRNTHTRIEKLGLKAFWTTITPDQSWEIYLNSFPKDTNNIFRVRNSHDCNTCKTYIKRIGSLVFLDGKFKRTVFDDAVLDESLGEYNIVAKAMQKALIENEIISLAMFHPKLKVVGKYTTPDNYDDTILWHHLSGEVPQHLLVSEDGSVISEANALKSIFGRALYEITPDAIDTVIDLIESDSLYKGDEYLNTLKEFRKIRNEYFDNLDPQIQNIYEWNAITTIRKSIVGIRNTVIGTLLTDLSEGKDIESAVKSFEDKVAPANFKRSKSIITPKMKEEHLKIIDGMGYRTALKRRHAKINDITINNVIYVDKDVRSKLKEVDELDALLSTQVVSKQRGKLTGIEIGIEDFIVNVIPKASKIEALVKNVHEASFVSLIAPADPESKVLTKWDNNFSWTYNGNLADSDIRARVKSAGGAIDKDLRISLSWFNTDDLDIHCTTPTGSKIYHGNKQNVLDVDMNVHGESTTPVENLAWNFDQLHSGEHSIYVNNFTQRNSSNVGFVIEVEFEGNIQTFNYNNIVRDQGYVKVFNFAVENGKLFITNVNKDLDCDSKSKNIWNINTNQFVAVNSIMLSPNYWDGNANGNKHYFFMLDGCKADVAMRGLYAEMITQDLHHARKSLEVLGDLLKCPEVSADEQLSGLGFSSTLRKSLTVKVTGADKSVKQYIIKF